jgi:hypothetical protein
VQRQNLEAALERGVKLDDLVEQSADLSTQAKIFYKGARKANRSCCHVG